MVIRAKTANSQKVPQTQTHFCCTPWIHCDRYHKQEASIFRSRQLLVEENQVTRLMPDSAC